MKIPNGPITEGICGAAANLLCIHNLVSKRSSVLASLDVVESALDWIARLAAKICRGQFMPRSCVIRIFLVRLLGALCPTSRCDSPACVVVAPSWFEFPGGPSTVRHVAR